MTDTTGAGDVFTAGNPRIFHKNLIFNTIFEKRARAGHMACGYQDGFPRGPPQPFVHDAGGASERVLERD
ncbi:hypothetical protein [Aestuariivirga sp.]|uniref:hypothetical protein n=1 Tax=Aestuariivirga sp. TaxID=2650926 RepID=UPI0030159C1C